MGMHVPRRDRLHAEVLGEVVEGRMASRVAPLEGTLQLDEEPLPPECGGEPRSTGLIVERKPFARAAGEADEPLAQLRDGLERDGGRQEDAVLLALRTRSGMGRGQDAAEVRVALAALAEQRDVRSSTPRSGAGQAGTSAPGRLRRAYAAECHLGAGDRPYSRELGGVRELERAVDAVVIGERERLVAELRRTGCELLRMRRPVEERVCGVTVELDVDGGARGHTALS